MKPARPVPENDNASASASPREARALAELKKLVKASLESQRKILELVERIEGSRVDAETDKEIRARAVPTAEDYDAVMRLIKKDKDPT